MPQIPDSRVLIVATDGFEEWELFGPRQILQQRGAEVVLASLKRDPIQATVHDDPGKTIRPDLTIEEVIPDDFDALILPGGVRNPDTLRLHGNEKPGAVSTGSLSSHRMIARRRSIRTPNAVSLP